MLPDVPWRQRALKFCCHAEGRNGELALEKCKIISGNGVLVTDHAHLQANNTALSGSHKTGIQVRHGASCNLSRCNIMDCKNSSLWQGRHHATLTDCTITRCGEVPEKAGVVAQCGKLVVRRCHIEFNGFNRADGIQVYDATSYKTRHIRGRSLAVVQERLTRCKHIRW